MHSARTLVGGRLVTPAGVLEPGWVRIEGGVIAALGTGPPADLPGAPAASVNVEGAWVFPGFIDGHVHGGGGGDFATGGAAGARMAVAFHRAHGTTRLVASLLSAPVPAMAATIAELAPLVDEGVLAGVHLEGPFLSPACCGAHDPRYLGPARPVALEALLGAGPVTSVTLAPELAGGLDAVRQVVDAGATAAIGHSDATYAQAVAAVDAGARVATHLYNAMRPWHHREPGIVGAAMDRPEVVCEVINDGAHVHDAALRQALALGPGRVALVTDAIAATGQGDGAFTLGGRPIQVRNGRATLAATGALAGSTLTMDRAVRRSIVELGVAPEAVAAAAATTPARVLGLAGVTGALAPGLAADLVVMDPEFRVRRVMVRGQWIEDGEPSP